MQWLLHKLLVNLKPTLPKINEPHLYRISFRHNIYIIYIYIFFPYCFLATNLVDKISRRSIGMIRMALKREFYPKFLLVQKGHLPIFLKKGMFCLSSEWITVNFFTFKKSKIIYSYSSYPLLNQDTQTQTTFLPLQVRFRMIYTPWNPHFRP